MAFLELIGFAILILIILLIGYFIGKKAGIGKANREWENNVPNIREDAIKKSRAVLGGQFSEQLAPYLPDFPYSPTEARFIGKPIDFIIFEGMDNKEITAVKFVEVKSGKSSLSTHERKLKDVIINKNISWEEYRIPENLTKKL